MSVEVSEGLLYFLKYPLLLLVYLFLACMFRAMVGSLPRRRDLVARETPQAAPGPRPSAPAPVPTRPSAPAPAPAPIPPRALEPDPPPLGLTRAASVWPAPDSSTPAPASSPSRARAPWLEVVAGMDSPPERIPLGQSLLFGRAADCTVRLPDPFVSSHHARLTPDPEGPVLEDLGSRNGTWIGEERLQGPVRLEDGEAFAVGDVTFRYHAS